EGMYMVAPGLEHKYQFTAVLLANNVCGGFCRFCFRKRLFMNDNDEVARDVGPALDYIRNHPQISNVLVTGGDPLLLSTARLRFLLSELRAIDHVRIIRIGSKMPAFNPYRILNDPDLVKTLGEFSTPERRVYLMAHFNHPRELTEPALEVIKQMLTAGIIVCNQTPLLRGVNASPEILGDLLNRLSYVGAAPYYVFQVRPTLGNSYFVLPVEEAYLVFEQAKMLCSGLAKRARLVMSHVTGKIEVVGMDAKHVHFRYHQAADPAENSRFLTYRRNPSAYWFDDYTEAVSESLVASACVSMHG
ncbi:MAG: KamA family radical SAM protein, partial [Actinobacteria bacterium]|nr:KamA family radical SAM protein [Actinomycetota bacterium]